MCFVGVAKEDRMGEWDLALIVGATALFLATIYREVVKTLRTFALYRAEKKKKPED